MRGLCSRKEDLHTVWRRKIGDLRRDKRKLESNRQSVSQNIEQKLKYGDMKDVRKQLGNHKRDLQSLEKQ